MVWGFEELNLSFEKENFELQFIEGFLKKNTWCVNKEIHAWNTILLDSIVPTWIFANASQNTVCSLAILIQFISIDSIAGTLL
jgi:hypothetical protein